MPCGARGFGGFYGFERIDVFVAYFHLLLRLVGGGLGICVQLLEPIHRISGKVALSS
jgi:hypothetical protein